MRVADADQQRAKRQAIVAAARVCFAEHGFHQTSTDMVRKAAGISSGSLFHYFPNKKALMLAVVERQNCEITTFMNELVQLNHFGSALAHFLNLIIASSMDRTERNLVLEIVAEAGRDADVASLNRAGDEALRAGMEILFRQGAASGQIVSALTVSQFVNFVLVLVDGIYSRSGADPDYSSARERECLLKILNDVSGVVDAG